MQFGTNGCLVSKERVAAYTPRLTVAFHLDNTYTTYGTWALEFQGNHSNH